ncbi:MAG: aspartate aminotransferase family protein [Desulfobacteraceae bacterium 4572_123]|nr:MAG: aspartate aminotransferase family protein [Desulfobacteraceae bacterium 4572_123]
MSNRPAESIKRIEGEQGDVNTTANRRKYWKRNLSDEAKKWFEEDKKYFLHQSLSTPVLNVLARAYGIYLEDMDGKRYIDMHGNGVHNAGFNNPAVIKAVKDQLDDQMTFSPRRYTCPGGSEAIEMALMLARQVTGNFKTISFWDSFHGAGFGAAGVGGEEHFSGGLGPMLPGTFHVEFPNYYRNPWNFENSDDVDAECLRQMELVMQRHPEIAAIIGEPISATPVVPSKRYWQGVRKLCDKYGALLIFDEIIEGFGRTGKMFASEHYLTPDILILGKSLGGGLLPLAGIVTKEKYNILQHRSIGHYTHEKNALSAAAGMAEIEYIEQNDLCNHAAKLGEYTINRLKKMQADHPLIGNVMGIGLHLGIDLVSDPKTKKRAVNEAEIVMFKCMEKGLAFKTIEGNIITLRPSLVITSEKMDTALDILEQAIDEVEKGYKY